MKNRNKIELIGRISSEIICNLEAKRYEFSFDTTRKSGYNDKINCRISSKLISYEDLQSCRNKTIKLIGRLCTENVYVENKSHLIVYAYIFSILIVNTQLSDNIDLNTATIEGYVCTNPVYRLTPKGCKICDMIVACNTTEDRTEYIPVIMWNRCAESAKNLKVGDMVNIIGRLQSREYAKEIVDKEQDQTAKVIKTTYELSCIFFSKCK